VLTCAIGDVHGHMDKLAALLARCKTYLNGREARFVFIGDYIDRGPDSRAVVEFLMDLQTRRPPGVVVCLRGNHEAVVVGAARGTIDQLPGPVDVDLWLSDKGGGSHTLASYGVSDASGLPDAHLDWMARLPLCFDDGTRYFAHAGVHPERRLDDQVEEDLVWIREPFLSHTGDFGRLIVHGHTPVTARAPDWRVNRLNIDTGAGYDGPLTAVVFDAAARDPLAVLTDRGELPMGAAYQPEQTP
jgi:Calcineurin-like phosphoesterase